MKKNIQFFAFLSVLIYLTACSEEIVPVYPDGNWEGYYFEKKNCNDSTLNVAVDLGVDSIYDIDGRMVRFLSYDLDLTTEEGLEIREVWNIDGKDSTIRTTGEYFSSGLNDIVLCPNQCEDSIFLNGIYLHTPGHLEISWLDTFPQQSGCGVFLKANSR